MDVKISTGSEVDRREENDMEPGQKIHLKKNKRKCIPMSQFDPIHSIKKRRTRNRGIQKSKHIDILPYKINGRAGTYGRMIEDIASELRRERARRRESWHGRDARDEEIRRKERYVRAWERKEKT